MYAKFKSKTQEDLNSKSPPETLTGKAPPKAKVKATDLNVAMKSFDFFNRKYPLETLTGKAPPKAVKAKATKYKKRRKRKKIKYTCSHEGCKNQVQAGGVYIRHGAKKGNPKYHRKWCQVKKEEHSGKCV